MFGISTPELIVILIVALLILGPRKIPGIARTIGKSLRDIQRTISSLSDVEDGLDHDDDTPPAPESKPGSGDRQPPPSPPPGDIPGDRKEPGSQP